MAAARLSPLWTTASRCTEIYNPTLRSVRAAQRIRRYHPTSCQHQEQIPQRYGTANEPPPHLGGGKAVGTATEQQTDLQDTKALPKIGEQLQHDGEKEVNASEEKTNQSAEQRREPTTVDGRPAITAATTSAAPMSDPMLDGAEASPSASHQQHMPTSTSTPNLNSILNSVAKHTQTHDDDSHAEDHPDKSFDEHSPPVKAPHIEAPRYIHHFDTHGLVKRLTDGKWDSNRAITIMKAMRLLLADNTDLAKEALVSKSNLENEAYLFTAACAELKTEVVSRRRTEQEKLRTERAQVQHEVDIISQRVGQETMHLKDDLKGFFDDRKMAVRNEQRNMESKIQGLNNMITVELQADAKSEVEGLRWIMTRRVIITLFLVVAQVLLGLKVMSDAFNADEAKSKKKKEIIVLEEEEIGGSGGTSRGQASATEGEGADLVSLG